MNRIHYFVKSGMLRLGFKDDKRDQTTEIKKDRKEGDKKCL